MTLWNIVFISFNILPEHLAAPDWMREPRFDISAKVPAGATREQLFQMLQNMLIDRFSLKFHHEQREVQGYELVVAKDGPKFKEAASEPPNDLSNPSPQPARSAGASPLGPDGFPTVPPGVSGLSSMANRTRRQWVSAPMRRIVRDISVAIGAPVVDATGLNGTYDLSLYYVNDVLRSGDEGGPSIFGALQSQLGLKLEPKKTTVPFVIVDHAERAPTAN